MSRSTTRWSPWVLLVVAPIFSGLVGCSTSKIFRLKSEPRGTPIDESVVSGSFKPNKYKRIIVIPPSGTARGGFDRQINYLERQFLKNNVTVISSAITGRILRESSAENESKTKESGSLLSDIERALVLAKDTGADAILQVGEFKETQKHELFFVVDGEAMKICSQVEYLGSKEVRAVLASETLTFIGKLIDVKSAEVVSSYKIHFPTVFAIPQTYQVSMEHKKGDPFSNDEVVVELAPPAVRI